MKKTSIQTFVIFSVLLIAISCKKNAEIEPTTNPPITLSPDSNYLSKMYIIDKNGPAIDTGIVTFLFDNLKRVKKKLDVSLNSSSYYIDSTIYTYLGNSMLPNLITTYSEDSGNKDTTFKNLLYSNTGTLLRDSTIGYYHYGTLYSITKEISNYTQNGNKIYGISVFNLIYNSTGVTSNYTRRDTLTLDANTNLIGFNNLTIYGLVPPQINRQSNTYTYGNNPSPFVNLNISKANMLPGDIYTENASRNNILSIQEKYYNNGTLQNTFIENYNGKYSFKLNGYPSSILLPDPSIPGDYLKVLYFYITL